MMDLSPANGGVDILVNYLKEVLDGSDLSCVLCIVGPGGFTGIRAGLSAVQGIMAARHVPCVQASSFEIYECQNSNAIICIESKRIEKFFKVNDKVLTAPLDAAKTLFNDQNLPEKWMGDLDVEGIEMTPCDHGLEPLCRRIVQQIADGTRVPTHDFPQPMYLREADVSISKQVFRNINR